MQKWAPYYSLTEPFDLLEISYGSAVATKTVLERFQFIKTTDVSTFELCYTENEFFNYPIEINSRVMSIPSLLRLGQLVFTFWVLCSPHLLKAQDLLSAQEVALRFLRANPDQFHLTVEDVADVRISDVYASKHNGVVHVWVQQQYAGIPVYNALFGLHVRDREVYHIGHRFVYELSKRVNTTMPSLSAGRALELALLDLGFTRADMPYLKQRAGHRKWIFDAGKVARQDIPIDICYDLDEQGQVRLAWKIFLDQANTSDMWTITVDAVTGQILRKHNHTVYCKVGHVHRADGDCSEYEEAPAIASSAAASSAALSGVDEAYRVFALPVESPAHGDRSLVINPAHPVASPYGWLDTDGNPGPEYTYTRGNNVWAYEDRANDNTPSANESAPSTNYVFDFPYNPDAEPNANLESAITNLFYMNNMMHDITYRFGFDEPAGNFQQNNYGRGGVAGDFVRAEALDGGGENNANFATPADGGNGRMQMYLWSGASGNVVRVNAPVFVQGTYYAQAASDWGAPITDVPVTGEVVITDDGSGSDDATKNCQPPVNNLQGKIAMVDRGICQFGLKALTAQQAGAIACIICNFEDATVGMAAGDYGAQVTIPVVMMTKPNCDLLRQYAGLGLNISLVRPTITGPERLDGSFDNGIIAHEYGHGVSNRLTGGPSQAGCLGNAEQMGEGWSDWFTLITSVRPGDVAAQRRGVGTFVLRQPNDGVGIRRVPYTTNMAINPHTYGTVANSAGVHAIGEVWATVTWDLYWAFVEKYGYDPDWNNTNSGNYRAVQLVMDGMKLQPCSPGFLDGRDAIMLADILNYNGEDTCLISQVFARRGMGIYADQGSSDNSGDGVEDFTPIPTCIKELKISKSTTTPLIDAGGEATFTITVTNHKDEAVSDVVVTDPLPAGLSLVSASHGGTDVGGVVTWNLGTLLSGDQITLTYTAKSDPSYKSLLYFRDDMEEEGDRWSSFSLESNINNTFYLQEDVKRVGERAWRVDALPSLTDQVLFNYIPITVQGNQPVLRFWHRYNTEPGADAGFLEVQVDGESNWRRFDRSKVFRDGYSGNIQYGTFAIPFLSGFSGNSGDWVRSYFDLSEYIGKDILFRFRFGTDDNTAPTDPYWIIDQVDIMDMLNYDTEACVRSSAGDLACARAAARGVVVDPGNIISTKEDQSNGASLGVQVQPNPASEWVAVTFFGADVRGPIRLSLTSIDGRELTQLRLEGAHKGQVMPINISHLASGIYLLRVESPKGYSTAKVVKK